MRIRYSLRSSAQPSSTLWDRDRGPTSRNRLHGKRPECAHQSGNGRTRNEEKTGREREVDRHVPADAEREQDPRGRAPTFATAPPALIGTTPAAALRQRTVSAIVGENSNPRALSSSAVPAARVVQQTNR